MLSSSVIKRMSDEVHVMADIETLDTSPDACTVQIGGVAFRVGDKPGSFLREFNCWINIASNQKAGRFVNGGTIQWWMGQSEEAIRAVFDAKKQIPLTEALRQFRAFYDGSDESLVETVHCQRCTEDAGRIKPASRVWGHGATFDVVILESCYRSVDSRAPFSFRDARDTRTLFDLVDGGNWNSDEEVDMVGYGPKHDGLADAKRQAVVVQRAFRTLAGN